MRKLIKPKDISPELAEAIKKDRQSCSLNELVYKYSIAYPTIAAICKGIEREVKAAKKDFFISQDIEQYPATLSERLASPISSYAALK